jgi:lipopolysaccharide assembly outer membrane protein LptD (OstA)
MPVRGPLLLLCLGLFLGFAAITPDSASTVSDAAQGSDEIDRFLAESAPEEEPWRFLGGKLSGSLDGSLQIDSLEIQHGRLRIAARRGIWRPEERFVELQEDVEIRDSLRVLTARHGLYYRDRLFLEMETQVRGRGPEGKLRCDRLTYDRRHRLLSLGGRVHLDEDDGRTLRCEWLRYDLADSFMTGGGNVRLHDAADSIDIFGDLLFYDRAAGLATVIGQGIRRPRLLRHAVGSEAAVTIEADTLKFRTRDRVGEALGRVTLSRGALRGSCDRALFLMAHDRLELVGSPVMRDAWGQVAGDSMLMELRDGHADRMTVWGHTRAEHFPPDQSGEAHFAVGDTLSAYFGGGTIRSVVVEHGAEALYLPSPQDRAEGVGLNWTRGERIRLILADGRVSRVQFEGEVAGRYILPAAPVAAGPRAADTLAVPAAAEPLVADTLAVPAAAEPLVADTLAAPVAAEPLVAETVSLADSLGADSLSTGVPPDSLAPDVLVPDPELPGLAAIRRMARAGTLEPPDSLLGALAFDLPETVHYSGDAIDFGVATERMTISGDATVTYGSMELLAEEIVFDPSRNLVLATGEPLLRDGDSEVRGEEMTYRIDSKKGLVFQGRSEFEGGYYRGERVKRVDTNAFFAQNADFTSCDAEVPHFHFRAAKMKVVTKEKVVARPLILYLGNIPIFLIPYAAFPIRSGRQSGLLLPTFEFGFDTDRGRFLRNVGYYLAPNDYMDAMFWLDYYEEQPRLGLNARLRYKVRYLLNGRVEGSFMRDESYGGAEHRRWLLKVNHDQVLGERFNFKVSGHFQSDKDYAADRDFGASVDDRVNQVLRSQMSLGKSWSGASVSLAADRTEYLDEQSGGSTRISQSAPSINFALSSFPIGIKPDERGVGGRLSFLSKTYLRADFRLRSLYRKTWDGERSTNQAAQINASLSDKRRLLNAINLTPSVSLSTAWAHKDAAWDDGDSLAALAEKNVTGFSWRTGLSASTTVYGTFFPHLGSWEGIRHVVEMSAGYSYSPELPELKGFPSVGGISLGSSKRSGVSFRVTQRFHFKFRKGEEVSKRENLLIWNSSTSYDFLAKEKGRSSHWSDLSQSLRLQPGRFLSSELSVTHKREGERWRRSNLSVRTSLRLQGGGGGSDGSSLGEGIEATGDFGDPEPGAGSGPDRQSSVASLTGPWKLSMSHVFSMPREWSDRRSSLNMSAGISPTRNWRLQYSVYYDLKDQEVASQGYSLYRDLHCWQAVLERRTSGGHSSYYFRISVKELPDLKYERRRM